MDIIQTLTIRHLKHNKKRTLSTIAGILTATVLLTMLSVFMTSFVHRLEAADVTQEDVKPLLSAASGMIAVVLAVLVIFLYNMLVISFRDRGRYLGILASVGATPFQRGRIAFVEAVILGSAGIPAGIGIGVLLSAAVFPFHVVLSWRVLLLIFLSECAAVLLTGLACTGRPGKGSVIELIHNRTDKRTFKKPVVLPSWTAGRFGAESNLALKNLVFFKRRYLIIGISFAVAMLLFLDGYIYMNYLDGGYEARDRRPKDNADLVLEEDYNKRNEKWDDFISEVISIPAVEGYSIQDRADLGTVLFEAKDIDPGLKEYTSYILGMSYNNPMKISSIKGDVKKGYAMNLVLVGMDDKSFRDYLDKAGLPAEYDAGKGQIPVLVEDHPIVKDGSTTKYRSIFAEGTRGVLSLFTDSGQWMYPVATPEGEQVKQFKKWEFDVLGVTTQTVPCYTASAVEEPNTIYFYTPQDVFDQVVRKDGFPAENGQTHRRLALKLNSEAPKLPDNVLYPAVVRFGNTTTRGLKLVSSSLSFLADEKMQNTLMKRGEEAGKVQNMIEDIGERYGLSDGRNMDIDNFDWSALDYTCNSYAAQITGTMSDPFPLLRHLFSYGVLIFLTVISVFQMIKIITSAVQTRRREFAVFLSLGMSRKQIAKMLYIENLIYTVCAYVAGLIFSILLALALFWSWGREQAVEPVFPYEILLMETAVFLVLSIFSVYLSVRSVKKIQLIDIIKEETM